MNDEERDGAMQERILELLGINWEDVAGDQFTIIAAAAVIASEVAKLNDAIESLPRLELKSIFVPGAKDEDDLRGLG